jgi:chondroitin AC lyase
LLGQLPAERNHTHFYDSDYTAHHRPELSVFVHALSTRTLATECVNQENKKGRMLADGTTTVYSRGEQYESAFPFFNWTLLPGTTEGERQSASKKAWPQFQKKT